MVGFYMIWAALPFVRPIFIYSKDVPADARTAISTWRKTSKFLEPEPFFPGYLLSLAHPYEMKLRWMRVEKESAEKVWVDTHRINGISFQRESGGKWTGWNHTCFGILPLP